MPETSGSSKRYSPSRWSSRILSYSPWAATLLLAGLCGALRFRGSEWAEMSVWFLLTLLPGTLCGLHHDLKRNRNTVRTAGLGAALSVAFGLLVSYFVSPGFVFMPLGFEMVVAVWSFISFILGATIAIVIRKTCLRHISDKMPSV